MSLFRHVMRIGSLTLAVCIAAAVHAQNSPGEALAFDSVTPRGHFELAAAAFSRTTVSIPGRLLLPPGLPPGKRVPAVVIHHGSTGVVPHYYSRWAEAIASAGYAAYVIDSFTPRKVGSTVINQDALSHAADIADAFGALRALAAHPSVDPARIAHLGFSRGGNTSVAATVEAFRAAVLGSEAPRFKVAVAHYPGCQYNFFVAKPSQTPLHIFIGEKDNYTPASQCATYADFMRKRGEDVTLKIYPDNFHNYDWDHPIGQLSGAQHLARCQPLAVQLDEAPPSPRLLPDGTRLVPEGTALAPVVAAVFKWRDACQSRGATTGYNASADLRRTAVTDTLAVLKAHFGE